MHNHKSPFLVFQRFLTPAECNTMAKNIRVEITPAEPGAPLEPVVRQHEDSQNYIFERLLKKIPEIEAHFDLKYKGTEPITFFQFPETNGRAAEDPQCYNAVYKRKKWIRTNNRDLTGVLWLKDYQDQPPFDVNTEVYGGKLEFPVYDFGFQPQAGTLVIFPSCERFINLTSSIQVGELQLAKMHLHSDKLWLYDPVNFPGDYKTWFQMIV